MSNNIWAQNNGFHREQVLFKAGTNDYYTYRIPSIVSSPEGALLAFCAARKGGGGDWDPIDIVMRRSTDGGKTWGPMKQIANHEKLLCDNAVPVSDYITGEVHLLYQVDYAR